MSKMPKMLVSDAVSIPLIVAAPGVLRRRKVDIEFAAAMRFFDKVF